MKIYIIENKASIIVVKVCPVKKSLIFSNSDIFVLNSPTLLFEKKVNGNLNK